MHGLVWASAPLLPPPLNVQARRPARQGAGEPPHSERCDTGWADLHLMRVLVPQLRVASSDRISGRRLGRPVRGQQLQAAQPQPPPGWHCRRSLFSPSLRLLPCRHALASA